MFTRMLYRHVITPAFETVYKRRKTLSYWKRLELTQWQPPDVLERLQGDRLRKLLTHCDTNVPYYARLFRDSGIQASQVESPQDLTQLPLLSKDLIRNHYCSLRDTSNCERVITKTTGGSTGAPLSFELNLGSHERRCAATHRGYGWAGTGPGSKQLHLWGVPLESLSRAERLKNTCYDLLLRRRMLNCFELSDATISRFLRSLQKCRPDSIVAYTNAIYHFALMLEERNLRPFAPHSIIVGAEKLHDFQRETIERVFEAPVFETYGSREFMLIGAECDRHEGLHLTQENLVVEIVDDDGSRTPTGEIGNVVVTDLSNYRMPFVRYLTGDLAVAGHATCSCGRGLSLLKSVTGRQLDVLRTPDGRRIPGEFFPHLLKDFSGIRQFQVKQSELTGIEIRAIPTNSWNMDQQQLIESRIRNFCGGSLRIDWRIVSQIPLTRSGKHRVVINELANRTLLSTAT